MHAYYANAMCKLVYVIDLPYIIDMCILLDHNNVLYITLYASQSNSITSLENHLVYNYSTFIKMNIVSVCTCIYCA